MAVPRLRRRTVYLTTVVAMFAMVGGFALAVFPNAFSVFGGNNGSGQNSGSFVAGNTIWSNGAMVSLILASSPSSCALSTLGNAATVYLTGSVLCATGGSTEWYEAFHFTANEAPGDSDTFHWFVLGGVSPADQPFTLAQGGSYTGSVTLDVYIDMGPGTGNPIQLSGLGISATVAGS